MNNKIIVLLFKYMGIFVGMFWLALAVIDVVANQTTYFEYMPQLEYGWAFCVNLFFGKLRAVLSAVLLGLSFFSGAQVVVLVMKKMPSMAKWK